MVPSSSHQEKAETPEPEKTAAMAALQDIQVSSPGPTPLSSDLPKNAEKEVDPKSDESVVPTSPPKDEKTPTEVTKGTETSSQPKESVVSTTPATPVVSATQVPESSAKLPADDEVASAPEAATVPEDDINTEKENHEDEEEGEEEEKTDDEERNMMDN